MQSRDFLSSGKTSRIISLKVLLLSLFSVYASAQEVLPKPERPSLGFQGLIAQDASPPQWPARVQAPKGAPNVLLIMTDDVGFSASSTFGGAIPTPTLEDLAKRGLRFTQFNTTAVCSTTRAALLTGRNHHQVNMGMVPEGASGYEGYTSVIPKSAGTIAQILKESGYNTALFGKWHLTPSWERSLAGPFDHWPTQMGFEYFYGFLFGAINQWAPALTTAEPPQSQQGPAYHFDRDLADHAVNWIHQQKSVAPDKPFFAYYATATSHAPHDAPVEWIAKFKGQFDQGWDKVRAETIARQKKLGIVPQSTLLTTRPDEVPAWDSLSAEQKTVYAREMEVYAAALAYSDSQIERVLQAVKEVGALDNTLVIFIEGDNGASGLGGANGSRNDLALMNMIPGDLNDLMLHLDEMGGPNARNEYATGWGHAMNTPFQWWKGVASHFGGTRNGMVISWPHHIKDPGGIRTQFHHVVDIMPTVLDAAGIAAPAVLYGVTQQPLEGNSMLYSLNNPAAPSTRRTQYFAIANNVSLYHDGWVVATTPFSRAGMVAAAHSDDLEERNWELYHVADDFSEAVNLAAQEPKKLRQLQNLFWAEAARNHLLPIKTADFFALTNLNAGQKNFIYYPGVKNVPEGTAPVMQNRSFEISADVELADNQANGILATQGGRFGGFGFYMLDGKLVYDYNYFNITHYTVTASAPLPAGKHNLSAKFKYDGGGLGKGGEITLLADGKIVAQGRVEKTAIGIIQALEEGFDVGEDAGTPINEAYPVPFKFTDKLNKVSVTLN